MQRASGLLVDEGLAALPEAGKAGPGCAYDGDGRRRVVWTRERQKQIDRLIKELLAEGIGLVVVCRDDMARPDGKAPCGRPAVPEDLGTPDAGYGCECTRIHFR